MIKYDVINYSAAKRSSRNSYIINSITKKYGKNMIIIRRRKDGGY